MLFNSSLTVAAQLSVEDKKFKLVSGKHVPYDSSADVLATITATRRHVGQVFRIANGANIEDWHFLGGIADENLVIKGGGGKFGIEDNTSAVNRSIDMQGNSLSVNNASDISFKTVDANDASYKSTISLSGGSTLIDQVVNDEGEDKELAISFDSKQGLSIEHLTAAISSAIYINSKASEGISLQSTDGKIGLHADEIGFVIGANTANAAKVPTLAAPAYLVTSVNNITADTAGNVNLNGGAGTETITLLADGSYNMPQGAIITGIIVDAPNDFLLNIGTTAGGNDIANEVAVTGGKPEPITLLIYAKTAKTIYLSGINASTDFIILKNSI